MCEITQLIRKTEKSLKYDKLSLRQKDKLAFRLHILRSTISSINRNR